MGDGRGPPWCLVPIEGAKSLLPPSAAEYSFKTDVFFMILLRKIMKNTSVLNLNLARSAMKRLFTQPLRRIFCRCRRQKPFYTTPIRIKNVRTPNIISQYSDLLNRFNKLVNPGHHLKVFRLFRPTQNI
jgi:hypothetical protein